MANRYEFKECRPRTHSLSNEVIMPTRSQKGKAYKGAEFFREVTDFSLT